jgi:hypothetical protein
MNNVDGLIHSLLARPFTVDQAMRTLLVECSLLSPSPKWPKLAAIKYDRDIARLRDWLQCVTEAEPPLTKHVAALWFGLYNPVVSRHASIDFYIAGSSRYEHDSDSADWACNSEYFPRGRYGNSEILHQLSTVSRRLPRGSVTREYTDVHLPLGYLAFVVKALLPQVPFSRIAPNDSRIPVAIGWDSGSPLYIATLSADGLLVRDPNEANESLAARKQKADKWFEDHYGSKPT